MGTSRKADARRPAPAASSFRPGVCAPPPLCTQAQQGARSAPPIPPSSFSGCRSLRCCRRPCVDAVRWQVLPQSGWSSVARVPRGGLCGVQTAIAALPVYLVPGTSPRVSHETRNNLEPPRTVVFKVSPTSSLIIIWELIRNENYRAPTQTC